MFSVRKILQVLYYLQSNSPLEEFKGDIMYLLKLLFFADRYHVRHFGFVASGDKYCAMKFGPVASATYDVMRGKIPNVANSAEISLLEEITSAGESFIVVNKQQDDELSKSFKKALDFAIQTYGKYKPIELSSISHDYPEWKKHEQALKSGKLKEDMVYIDFFEDPSTINYSKEYGINEDPFKDDIEFLNALKEDFNASSC
jgi:Uncharacterized phage-associated protein